MKNNLTSVTYAFTETLIKQAKKNKRIVVLDADLSDDLYLKKFSKLYPKQFVQNGIAEQDMVSMAGGMARFGLIPIVNSFASFLTARGNEQIYNNATEMSKIIYINLYSGAIPAGAGKSHQSLRDISLLSNIPNFKIFHPYNNIETEEILKYCLKEKEKNNCAIRLSIGPMPEMSPQLPINYKFEIGKGTVISKGTDALLFAYGQTMISESIKTAKILLKKNISLEIVNLPCLNYFDKKWFRNKMEKFKNIFFLDDHNINGGMSDLLISFLSQENLFKDKKFKKLGFKDFPACGTTEEVLRFHKLDYKTLSDLITKRCSND